MFSKTSRRNTHIPLDEPKVNTFNEYGATIAISSVTILASAVIAGVILFLLFQ